MSESKPCPECRHVKPSGARCHSPALRDKQLCYYHARTRSLVDNNRYRNHSVALPPLEDRASIQLAIDEVLAASAAGKIDRRDAGRTLWAIQMASKNLALAKGELASMQPVTLYQDQAGDVLAADEEPEAEDQTQDQAQDKTELQTCNEPRNEELITDESAGTQEASAQNRPAEPGESASISAQAESGADPTPSKTVTRPKQPRSADTNRFPLHLDIFNTCGTHEYDREPPRIVVLTKQQKLETERREAALRISLASVKFEEEMRLWRETQKQEKARAQNSSEALADAPPGSVAAVIPDNSTSLNTAL